MKPDVDAGGETFDRVIKIAGTIADLDASVKIKSSHVAEALQYRPTDNN